jgi:phosphoenolpyruvate carboxykinase (diphosphate)
MGLSGTNGHVVSALSPAQKDELVRYINLKLVALGRPYSRSTADLHALDVAGPLLRNYHQKDQLLGNRLCPADTRIQEFLDSYLRDICPGGAPRLPSNSFVLDRPRLARVMSLPPGAPRFRSPWLDSFRLAQGVLHNPKSDRRTTQGLFHIVEDGLPVPADKTAVPRRAFATFLAAAFRPPDDISVLPFTADQDDKTHLFVSLLLRPVVCPATERDPRKTMEIRFFAPGTLVSNLDFVEMIFGNGGDPYLPENDAALDVAHWTGHSGCVILAPHIVGMKKVDLGLPHFDQATERQRCEGMCWRDESEVYNEGRAFKIACRDRRGVMVTIIADNYYGYCKKEVKTQISFAANLYGLCEEEHAGGAIAYPAYVLGQDFRADRPSIKKAPFEDIVRLLGDRVEVKPEGYAVDRNYPGIHYVPGTAEFNVREGVVRWTHEGAPRQLTLLPDDIYVLPSGYKVRLEKQLGGTAWRLVGTVAHGTLCHKPCTVSGGGKSEISKSISSVLLTGPVFVRDYFRDLDQVSEILKRDFSSIYKQAQPGERSSRPILSPERSLGSVIKLFTASPEYTDDYNDWLHYLPQTIRQLVFAVKRYYRPEWGEDWRGHFTVDRINGYVGHELKYDNQKLVGNYLRVGFDPQGSWRIYKLRPDFHPADKVQVEDDITASVVVPRRLLSDFDAKYPNPSARLVENCEAYLFQRPDDAIHRGFDAQAEADIATPGTFISNFEPLSTGQARVMVDHVVDFDRFTAPMKHLLADFVKSDGDGYVVSSDRPRMVNGAPSKNPRYLQQRPDRVNARETYLAEVCARLDRGVPPGQPLHFPVNAVLAGRRGNPADPSIALPPLAVYNPIHYQELPELFMDFVCSLTGKSPSTTGFGSEGALTKGPFNALSPVVDLNNALVGFILTEYAGFTTAAGYAGPHYRVDHDISMLVPELWCRIRVEERDPRFLIDSGFLEKLDDFEHGGRMVPASRLGYRITSLFADRFLGRIFETPDTIFTDEILHPEKQDLDAYVSGVEAIAEAQKRVALNYFEDGSVEGACPPLRALLHIMAHGAWEGKGVDDPEVRAMFTRGAVLGSEWYAERLRVKQERDMALWRRHVDSLESFRSAAGSEEIDLEARLAMAREQLARVSADAYREELVGTIGADPFTGQW